MRVHFALFKHATWLSERVEFDAVDEEEEAPDLFEDEELRPLSMACFCRASLIPALKALDSISELAHLPAGMGWDPVIWPFGPVLSWNQERLRITRRTLLLGCGPIVEKACLPLPAVPLGIGAFGRPRGDFK